MQPRLMQNLKIKLSSLSCYNKKKGGGRKPQSTKLLGHKKQDVSIKDGINYKFIP